jgi:hypothetical protein
LTPGANYEFKVEARNSVGFSLLSASFTILCAQPPDQPTSPVTSESASNVILTWDAPYNGGSDILSYMISFQHSDLTTYSEDITICDGSQAGVILTRSCTIAGTIFTATPFNFAWGSSIYAKVLATNIKGDSVESLSGNGAVILRVPDAPVSLFNIPSITLGTTIGIEWQDGVDNGGTDIIDYQVSFALSSDTYVVLETGVTS